MKFLGSFNTKLDEHELYDAIQKNGQGNAIMMKKHRVFLIRPIVWMLFSFVAFGLIIWFTYYQFYEDYNILFRIIVGAYSLVTLARSLHSLGMVIYDINLQAKNPKGYIDTIEESDFKDGRYEHFLKHSLISLVLQVVIMIGNAIASIIIENGGSLGNIGLNILVILTNVGFIWLLYKTLDRIIDYEMDFNIFTSDQFIIYRQHGFFKTESMNIAASTIKIVNESKSGFWGSLFHYGEVSIHPEGDMNTTKAIQLFYVPHPKDLTKKLNEFIEKSKEGINVTVAS